MPDPTPPTTDIATVPIDDLIRHPETPRRGDIPAISASIEVNGWYGAVVAQSSTRHVLAGNHRMEAARRLGMTDLPVHWLDVDDATARRILLADNRTSDLATYDDEVLVQLLEAAAADDDLFGSGYDGDDLDDLLADIAGDIDNKYASQIVAPVYHPTGDNPAVTDLSDTEYAETLRSEIEAAGLDDDLRQFLLSAAERHTVFNFAQIAEFYAHADADVQHLMERSGLVIIDFDKAVENGFVSMSHILAELAGEQRS